MHDYFFFLDKKKTCLEMVELLGHVSLTVLHSQLKNNKTNY